MLTAISPFLQLNPYTYLHAQEVTIKFKNARKLIRTAIHELTNGETKLHALFFRRFLGKHQKGYDSRSLWFTGVKAETEFRYRSSECANIRYDLRRTLLALYVAWLGSRFWMWATLIEGYWIKMFNVALSTWYRTRLNCTLVRFEVYVLVPRAEVDTIITRLTKVAAKRPYMNQQRNRVELFHQGVDIGAQCAEVCGYYINDGSVQDFAKIEIAVFPGADEVPSDLLENAVHELERLTEGLYVLGRPAKWTGVALFGGIFLKSKLKVTRELRAGYRTLRKERRKRLSAVIEKEPTPRLRFGHRELDLALGSRGVVPGLYRFVISNGSDWSSVRIRKMAQRIVDNGETVVMIDETHRPDLHGPESRLACFYSGALKGNNQVDHSLTCRLLDFWLADELRVPRFIFVELGSPPESNPFWKSLGANCKAAGCSLILVYPHDTTWFPTHNDDVFCVRTDERIRVTVADSFETPTYQCVTELDHMQIVSNKITGRRAHTRANHRRILVEVPDEKSAPRYVPVVSYNPFVRSRGLVI